MVSVLDHLLELAQIGVECVEQAPEGAPANVAQAALDAGEIGAVEFGADRKLLLRELLAGAKDAQGISDFGLSGTCHIIQIAGFFSQNIVGARDEWITRAPRHQERELPARGQPTGIGLASFSPEQSSRGLQPQGGTMNTTTTQGVLFSLTAEDRPWTVEELIREKGDRLTVEDALAELEGMGLVNRINKRVVCASRAAICAEQLRL
jgi:hypothetical protein